MSRLRYLGRQVALAATVLTCAPVAAHADGFFLGLEAGATFPEKTEFRTFPGAAFKSSMDTGFSVGWNVGYLGNFWRAELENTYQRSDAKSNRVSGSLDIGSTMVNGYFDSRLESFGVTGPASRMRVYAGGGIGGAVYEPYDDKPKIAFAWQGRTGVGYDITDNWSVDLGYRYYRAEKVKLDTGTEVNGFNTHNILFGFKYNFGTSAPGGRRAGSTAYDNTMPPATQVSAYPSGMPGPSTLESQPPLPMAGQPMMQSPLPPLGDAAPGTRAGGQALMGFGQPGARSGATADTMAALPPSNGRQARASRAPAGEFRASNGGRYGVQVGAFRDRQKAMAAWPEKQAQFGLAGLQPKVVSANVPGKGRWERLYASGLSKGDADRLCSQIKARGDFCAVAAL